MATEVKPFRTEVHYERALRDVKRFWAAKSGTPEGDRLDVLATAITSPLSRRSGLTSLPVAPHDSLQSRVR